MKLSWCVYRHTAPDGRSYIGIALEPAKVRWANGKGYKGNPGFWECIEKYGWDNIVHEILLSGLDKFDALKRESEFIEKFNTMFPNGFNRRLDDGRSHKKNLKEVGDRYGHSEVIHYWPDENRRKVYRLKCDCGKEFVCNGCDIKDDMSCGCL